MASVTKLTHAAICNQNGHIDREHANPKNTDIDPERTNLNYSFPMLHDGTRPFEYYKQRIGEVYLYGRGSHRESKSITGCSWVVSLPKELYGDAAKEKAFFQGTYDFISERYGKENIINNAVHYDEAGLPHIHVLFSPITRLDHEIARYKTKRTQHAEKIESGRYEYTYIHVDKNGKPADENNPDTWVKLNNYARISDYYDEKIDCNSVLNKIELKNFHSDLQQYLCDHGIEGKVITGKTGTNFTVKELKEFTATTGLHLDEVKEMMQDNQSLLQSYVDKDARTIQIEQLLHKKDEIIQSLQNKLLEKDCKLDQLTQSDFEKAQKIAQLTKNNADLERKISEMERSMEETKSAELLHRDSDQTWGHSTWGENLQSGWNGKTNTYNEEKTW